MQNNHIDLTDGSIWKKLVVFFLPILAGSLLQQLYTTADAVIIGRYAGKMGLAAIDSVHSLLRLPVNFLTGLSAGSAVIISQYIGAKRRQELSEAVHTALTAGVAGGTVIAIICIASASYCLYWLEVPASLFPYSLTYVRIYYGGFAFSMLYNIGAGILRAAGNSKTPFMILVIANSVNVVLDILFVCVFRWGVAGAAAATAFSHMLSAGMILAALSRKDGIPHISVGKLRCYRTALMPIVKIGLPIGLQSSLYPVANMMIQSGINSTGTDTIAAWALCGKLDFIIWLSADSLAAAVSTFAAQNYGAGHYRRIRHGALIGLGMTGGIVAVLSALLFFFCEPLGSLFIDTADYDLLPLMGQLMRFLSPLYIIYVFGEVLSAVIRGGGETFKPMLLTLIGTCASRILWMSAVVPHNRTVFTIVLSYPVSWILTAVVFIVFYQRYKKKAFPI